MSSKKREEILACVSKVVKWNVRVRGERLSGRGELAVAAAEEEQRLTRKQIGALHFTQENRVVAGDVGGDDSADDLGKGVFEERDAGLGPAIANA